MTPRPGPTLLRFADTHPEAWKNGAGTTRVLVDDSEDGKPWTFRVSVADVVGPADFSSFPGVDRRLLALGPGSLVLRANGGEHLLKPLDQVAFRGEDHVRGEPSDGPTQDLNVMTRRGIRRSTITLSQGSITRNAGPGVAFVVALEEGCAVGDHGLSRLDAVALPLDGTPVPCHGVTAFISVTDPTAAAH